MHDAGGRRKRWPLSRMTTTYIAVALGAVAIVAVMWFVHRGRRREAMNERVRSIIAAFDGQIADFGNLPPGEVDNEEDAERVFQFSLENARIVGRMQALGPGIEYADDGLRRDLLSRIGELKEEMQRRKLEAELIGVLGD